MLKVKEKKQRRSNAKPFAGPVVGLFVFYILHDYLQERSFSNPRFEFGWVMTFIELTVYSFSSVAIEGANYRDGPSREVLSWFIGLTLVLGVSQGSGSASLNFVTMPVKVAFKSCKLIPTMFFGFLLTGRWYSRVDYIAALFMCSSLIFLTIAEHSDHEKKAQLSGILLLMLSIFTDALSINFQEKIMVWMKVPTKDMLFWTNGASAVLLLFFTIINGELMAAEEDLRIPDSVVERDDASILDGRRWLFLEEPSSLFWVILQALAGYLGLRCYLRIIKRAGAAMAVVATSFRKILTITLSFVAFKKAFTSVHFLAICLLVAGVTTKIARKVSKSQLKDESSIV